VDVAGSEPDEEPGVLVFGASDGFNIAHPRINFPY